MMQNARTLFLDTNILLCATDSQRASHLPCLKLLEDGASGLLTLVVSGQVFREYLVVATRPTENNGLGLSPEEALHNVSEFKKTCLLVDENRATHQNLLQLIKKHQLRGKRIHDANIASTMLAHGISRLITLNPDDFALFSDLEMVDATIQPHLAQ
jgi:predicted nucleic acid-binding protein